RILAIVGSAKPGDRGFNRALDARRPIGSLVKPAVYYAALNRPQDFTLVTRLLDQPFGLEMPNGTRWEPQNFDKEPRGEVFLHEALERSYNLSTARLAIDVGIDAVVRSLRDMGVSTAIPAVPALALGALDLSPLEVARIYTTLAAGGYPSPLRAIAAVSRADGIELLRDELRLQQGLDRRVSYLLHWTLQRALSEGTGRSAANLLPPGQVLAGKTGTSDGQRDAWFAGFGSTLQATVWVGQDDNATMRLTGASGALPLWADFMAKAGASNLDLTPPRGVAMVAIDPDSGQLGGEGCTTLRDIPFLDGSAPDERAPCVQRRSWFERLWQ
ncbi:MAG: penicillin-binding transpeptidase domain-containing protein, partial [Oceanococcaceae bacterium]